MKVEAGGGLESGRGHIIKRPRLTRLLDETDARIILLIAPAGYGKTTLAREWLADQHHAWYRGTPATADVAAVALGLARAASVVVAGADKRLVTRLRVAPAQSDKTEALAELLAVDLDSWPADAWLVFDDYHFACDSEVAERFVEHLVASAPVRLLILSRSRPSWATARRLLYGEIYEVGRNQLAMNHHEANAILMSCAAKDPGNVMSLADGWPALIGLVALADEHELPSDGMPDELYSYFAQELYQALPEHTQKSLRRLSLARAVTVEIAESLFGGDADSLVSEATRLGFFVSTARGGLELHPLLRSFLASKFDRHRDDPDSRFVTGIVRILLNREEWDEAFELIERFFDNNLLVELFEAALLRMIDEARLPTLQRWLQTAALYRYDSPIIDFAEAEVSLKHGNLRKAEALGLQAARQLAPGHAFTSKALWLAGTSAHLTSRQQSALEHFAEAGQTARSESDELQALWGQFSATNKLDALDDAERLLDEFEERSGKSADDLLRAGTGRLMLATLSGHGLSALEAAELIAPLEARSKNPLIQSSFLNVYAAVLALAGRYADACECAQRELDVAMTYGLAFVIPKARFHLAGGLWGLRDFRRCAKILRTSEEACTGSGDHFLRMNIGVLRARMCLATGSTEQALETFESYRHPPSTRSMQAEYFAWWSLACALGKHPREATDLAARAEKMSSRIEVTGLVPWTTAVLAVQKGTSTRAVMKAWSRALQTGNIDAFVSAYRACPDVLNPLVADQGRHDQLMTVLSRARDHRLAQARGLAIPPIPARDGLAPLTRREQEVLDLVCQGLTNKEIGRTLYITESTAKAHVRKICTKFGVRSRTEAAMRAAELEG